MLRTIIFASFLFLSLTLLGCGGPKKPKPIQYLKPLNINAAGYTLVDDDTFIFEEKSVKLTLITLRTPDKSDAALIKALIKEGYLIVSMEIVNKTEGEKIIFNPSMTSLMSNIMGIRKPLDFTSLYQVAMAKEMERTLNRELKGAFYDSNEIVHAGRTTKKLLIFLPFDTRTIRAKLTIQEFYIGTDTINLGFPFKMIEEVAAD
jgi:hypothetical protein